MFLDLSVVPELIGRLHPALVHLPIGILLIACSLELLSSSTRMAALRPALPVLMLWGMIAACSSCLSGFLLYTDGSYEESLVGKHEWSGFILAASSIVLWLLYRAKQRSAVIKPASAIVLALVFLTGHLGGSLTHGEDFISEPLTRNNDAPATMKPVPNIQQALLYHDVVGPMFESKCYNCHGPKKQKGKLRLDSRESIIKGGEDGKTIVPGKAEESELVKRLLLPLANKDHMPPRGKPQLSREQIDVIKWWVAEGVDFNKSVHDTHQPNEVKASLLALQSGTSTAAGETADIPNQPVEQGDTATVRRLTAAGVTILPVSLESNYLSANFVSANGNTDSLLVLLASLKKQLLSLKLDGVQLKDSSYGLLSSFEKLTTLQLSHSNLRDESLARLKKLRNLRSLNVVGTAITANGMMQLKELTQLRNIYCYQTAIVVTEHPPLKKAFPAATIDFGNYLLPMLPGDTSEIKVH